jgi:hypothetical protein
MLKIHGHKGNANQNNTEISPTPVRITIIKSQIIINTGENAGEKK